MHTHTRNVLHTVVTRWRSNTHVANIFTCVTPKRKLQHHGVGYCVNPQAQQCASFSTTEIRTRNEKKRLRLVDKDVPAEPPAELSDVKADLIGPPDSASNIAQIKCYIPPDETLTEETFRQRRMEVLEWNREFWSNHNERFFKEKDLFIKENSIDKEGTTNKKKSLSPEEMSVFYRQFLNENRAAHLQYNKEWYKKNISLLWPALQVTFIRLKRKLKGV